jgi:hypothetical protein
VLDGAYQSSEGVPVFHEVRAPTIEQLQHFTSAGSSRAS